MLIACVLFLILELVTGRYEAAVMHLESGRCLLQSFQGPHARKSAAPCPSVPKNRLSTAPQSFQDHVVSVLSSLDVQGTHFGAGKPKLSLYAQDERGDCQECLDAAGSDDKRTVIFFESISTSDQHLTLLANDSLGFTGGYSDTMSHSLSCESKNRTRESLLNRSRMWYKAYRALITRLVTTGSCFDMYQVRHAAVMEAQYQCLYIATSTSYVEIEETDFDQFLPRFQAIVDAASKVISISGRDEPSFFTVESGLVAPLWLTVTKCRSPSLRRKGLSLLQCAQREGFWDPVLAHKLGSETMEYEESTAGFVYDQEASNLNQCELEQFLPLHARLSRVAVSIPNDQPGHIQLDFVRKRKRTEGHGYDFHIEKKELVALVVTRSTN